MINWVSPSECVLSFFPDFCDTDEGPGQHMYVAEAECMSGEVIDVPDGDGCFMWWDMGVGWLSSGFP